MGCFSYYFTFWSGIDFRGQAVHFEEGEREDRKKGMMNGRENEGSGPILPTVPPDTGIRAKERREGRKNGWREGTMDGGKKQWKEGWKKQWMEEWKNIWREGRMDGGKKRWMEGRKNGRREERTNGEMEERMKETQK